MALNANIYTYPSDIYGDGNSTTSPDTPYMIISAYPYKFKLQKSGDANNNKNVAKEYKFHFITYVPKSLSYSNSPTYANKKSLAVTTAVTGDTTAASKMVVEAVLGIADTVGGTYLDGLTEAIGLGKIYGTGKEQLGIGSGFWQDPRLVDVFQSPSFITQDFDFKLLANNIDEAKKIKMITTLFKYAAMPGRITNSLIGEIVPYLKSPMNFDVTIVTPRPNNKTKTLSLTYEYYYLNLKSVKIKPIVHDGREDIPFYIDGNTIGYDLSLSFSSMHPLIKPTVSGVGENDDGTIEAALKILDVIDHNEVKQTTVINKIKGK